MLVLLILFLVQLQISNAALRGNKNSTHHSCIHDSIDWPKLESNTHPQKYTIKDVTSQSSADHRAANQRRLNSTADPTTPIQGRKPMRIHVHYSFSWCDEISKVIEEIIIPPALKLFQESLLVTPVQGNWILNTPASQMIPHTPLPEWDLQSGGTGIPDTDYLLVVQSLQESRCGDGLQGTAAYAGPVAFDQYARPIMGVVNFCPAFIEQGRSQYEDMKSSNTEPEKEALLWMQTYGKHLGTAAHELGHAFGMAGTTWNSMRNFDGVTPRTMPDPEKEVMKCNPSITDCGSFGFVQPPISKDVKCADGSAASEKDSRVPADDVLWRGPLPDVDRRSSTGPIAFKIVTPTVQAAIRHQFGCDEVNGMQLEADDTGTRECIAAAHVEDQDMQDDFMCSSGGAGLITTETLALFHDMGFYTVDFSKAEPRDFRFNVGCEALKRKPTSQEITDSRTAADARSGLRSLSKAITAAKTEETKSFLKNISMTRRAFIPPGMLGDNDPKNQWNRRNTDWQTTGGTKSSVCDTFDPSRNWLFMLSVIIIAIVVGLPIIVLLYFKLFYKCKNRYWCLICDTKVIPAILKRCRWKKCCRKCLTKRCRCNEKKKRKCMIAPKNKKKESAWSSSKFSNDKKPKVKTKQQPKRKNETNKKNKSELAQIRKKYGAGSPEYNKAVKNIR